MNHRLVVFFRPVNAKKVATFLSSKKSPLCLYSRLSRSLWDFI